jgi:hypothetical protein
MPGRSGTEAANLESSQSNPCDEYLPDDADESGVKADFKDGMLNVTLPKSAKAKPKAIEVSVS